MNLTIFASKSYTVLDPGLLHPRVWGPNCYSLRFFVKFSKKIRLKTLLNPEISANCYAFFEKLNVTVRRPALCYRLYVWILGCRDFLKCSTQHNCSKINFMFFASDLYGINYTLSKNIFAAPGGANTTKMSFTTCY